MKSTVVDESLSSFKTNVLFQRIPTFYKIITDIHYNIYFKMVKYCKNDKYYVSDNAWHGPSQAHRLFPVDQSYQIFH